MADDDKSIRAMAKAISPIVNIGKNGLTDSVIEQVNKAFSRKTLIKIKLLRSCVAETDKAVIARRLADSTGSIIISLIGNKLVLHKQKKAGHQKKARH